MKHRRRKNRKVLNINRLAENSNIPDCSCLKVWSDWMEQLAFGLTTAARNSSNRDPSLMLTFTCCTATGMRVLRKVNPIVKLRSIPGRVRVR